MVQIIYHDTTLWENKWEFVDGSIEVPSDDDLNFAQWECLNNLIHSWIINSVSDQITSIIIYHGHALDACNDLHERFTKVDHVSILTLCSTINILNQDSKYVMEYFIELK